MLQGLENIPLVPLLLSAPMLLNIEAQVKEVR